MRWFRKFGEGLTTFVELLGVLRGQNRWWVIPLVVVLLAFGVLLILAQATPLGPLIYTLF